MKDVIRKLTALPWRSVVVLIWLGIVTGCAGPPPLADQGRESVTAGQCRISQPVVAPAGPSGSAEAARRPPAGDVSDDGCQIARGAGSDECFSLQPGRRVAATKTVRLKNGRKRIVRTTRTSRCQPQSLAYARCRSGIDNCRLGNTSPVQWYSCARKQGASSERPQAGSVLILAGDGRRNMPTGHPAFVEEVRPNADGTWSLRLSHTNYDRQCHLDQDAWVIFHPGTMTAGFVTGPWSAWATDLKVLGFILR